jgi:hypothetical protein
MTTYIPRIGDTVTAAWPAGRGKYFGTVEDIEGTTCIGTWTAGRRPEDGTSFKLPATALVLVRRPALL